MQVKENEVKEGPNDKSSVEFKGVDAQYQKATYECKTLTNSRDCQSWCIEFKHMELPTLESEQLIYLSLMNF